MKFTESKENLIEECLEQLTPEAAIILTDPTSRPLGPLEKTFLLQAERGDCASVRRLIEEYEGHPEELDINCVDPLNRSALIAAIENENIELIKLLIEEGIQVKDALLHAIKEEYVEGVEILLQYEEENHKPGQPYSWESVDRAAATFTADITPLILAAHRNNYEIIKILLDRGASLPMPHDIRCACDECVDSIKSDSLRHSQARINAYKALTASSLIALSSRDPVLTAFELSWELRKLSRMETEFRSQYNDMRSNVQLFAMSLMDHVRSSKELEIMLNYDPEGEPWEAGDHQSLERLKLAINYKQKLFVAHPSVQQLLATIWYEGLPGFRRKNLIGQMIQVAKLGIMFPVYCTIYMLAPNSKMGKFMKKPFVKFICHSSSYAFFLMLLGAASQRVELLLMEMFGLGIGSEYVAEIVKEWKRKERGAGPGIAECGVIIYVMSLIWGEMKTLWEGGLMDYISDLWNIVDFVTNMFYVMWVSLRMSSVYVVWREANEGRDPWYPREQWDTFDPMLLSEGAFAAGMIFSFLKLVHIFSVNPHLGPLQISLGRMIIDIVKFFFIYTLVLFAFGCGLNQLLWYYAELEKNKCYHLPSGLPDFDNNDKACSIWRRYANLFETSQSLFWASFGLVDLVSFELTGIKGFTRFWALLMFGSYSVINVIVLLNMLIAMMSNSYQIISERSDSEWKFARTRLWISYFEDGDTLPPPFNVFPTAKNFSRTLSCGGSNNKHKSQGKSIQKARERHETVMRLLVRRYVTAEQTKRDEFGVTEDDIMEVRQDVSTLRYELIEILRQNGMNTPKLSRDDLTFTGKKGKVMERRLLKDFHIGIVEGIVSEAVSTMKEPKDVFSQIARVIGKRRSSRKDWNALVRKNTVQDPIGTAQEAETMREKRQSLRRHIVTTIKEPLLIDHEKLLEYNPKLSEVPLQARVAYAKFMTKKIQQDIQIEDEESKKILVVPAKPPAPKPNVTFQGTEPPSDPGTSGEQKTADTEPKAVLDKSDEKVIAADDSLKTLTDERKSGEAYDKRPLSPIIASPTFSDEVDEAFKKGSDRDSSSPEDILSPIKDRNEDKATSPPPQAPRRGSARDVSSPEGILSPEKYSDEDKIASSPPEVPRRGSTPSSVKSLTTKKAKAPSQPMKSKTPSPKVEAKVEADLTKDVTDAGDDIILETQPIPKTKPSTEKGSESTQISAVDTKARTPSPQEKTTEVTDDKDSEFELERSVEETGPERCEDKIKPPEDKAPKSDIFEKPVKDAISEIHEEKVKPQVTQAEIVISKEEDVSTPTDKPTELRLVSDIPSPKCSSTATGKSKLSGKVRTGWI